MKWRSGFISNSSSTSFCIVGIPDNKISQQLQEQIGINEEEFYNGYQQLDDEWLVCYGFDIDNYWIGVEASTELEQCSIDKVRRKLADYIKNKYGENISLNNINLFYGEAGEG